MTIYFENVTLLLNRDTQGSVLRKINANFREDLFTCLLSRIFILFSLRHKEREDKRILKNLRLLRDTGLS